MKKFWNIISTVLIAAVIAAAAMVIGCRVAGMGMYAVLSGSMEPDYHVGSLIVVKPASAAELSEGDVITFTSGERTVVTHRITEVTEDGETPGVRYFRTKGDANDTEDAGLVHENNVIGRPVIKLPYLGYLLIHVQNPPGMYIAIAVLAWLLLISLIFGKMKTAEA